MYSVNPVLLATICLVILTVMIDKWTFWLESVLINSNKFPNIKKDTFHWTLSCVLVFIVAYATCWRLAFNYFEALTFPGQTPWDGYFYTALFMSGGCRFMLTVWENVEKIPGSIKGMIGSMFGVSSTTTTTNTMQSTEIAPEIVDESGEGGIK